MFLNGVDLTARRVGEIFECPDAAARMLVLEDWAEFVDPPRALHESDHVMFVFEEPNLPFWIVIDSHRNGKKDKLM